MRIIEPYVEVPKIDGLQMLKDIEKYGRVCYKSEGSITDDSYERFVEMIVRSGHHSVLEHEKITVKFVVDRGVSHELVRHRIASFSQSSTRYCNYSKDRFGNEITVIEPFALVGTRSYTTWREACEMLEGIYLGMIALGVSPQWARSVLPNSLKTEVVMTANLREWRHFFKLRCSKAAHPQMRQVAIPLLLWFAGKFPVLAGDIEYDRDFPQEWHAEVRELEQESER